MFLNITTLFVASQLCIFNAKDCSTIVEEKKLRNLMRSQLSLDNHKYNAV